MFCIVNLWNVWTALVHAKVLHTPVGKLLHGVTSGPQQRQRRTYFKVNL